MHTLSAILTCLVALFFLTFLASCQESIEERAAREAREYTEKNCPTPPQNDVITDSMVYDPVSRTVISYLRFCGAIDNAEALREHAAEIRQGQLSAIRQDMSLRVYKEAGLGFEYVCRSQSDPRQVLLRMKFAAKDYK